MVLLHALENDRAVPRISEDLDIVADVRVRPPALPRLIRVLDELGFASAGVSPEGVAHRFGRAGVLVDVLAPDNVGSRANLRTVGPATTIQAAGGAYALSHSSPVEVTFEARVSLVPRPTLAGALVIKSRAAVSDRGPKGPQRHHRDLAFLVSLVDDAFGIAEVLEAKNRTRLRSVTALADPNNDAWFLPGEHRVDALAAWAVLTRP